MSFVRNLLTENKLEKTHWGKIIIEADEQHMDMFEPEDVAKAGDWVTCACGEATANIAKDKLGYPTDPFLLILGGDFYAAVMDSNPEEAAFIMIKIEKRASTLVGESV